MCTEAAVYKDPETSELFDHPGVPNTREEAARAWQKEGPALNSALAQLKRENCIYPLSRGFCLALDVQHQAKGVLDPVWFVDDWARYHRVECYVAGLSAAMHHGAAHQRPMQFQAVTDREMRSIRQPKLHLALLLKKKITSVMWGQRKSPAGYFRLATPEMTACDIVAYHRSCPSLDLAATVLVELGEVLSVDRLSDLIEQGCMISVLQRLGWLLEYVGWQEEAEGLYAASAKRLSWREDIGCKLPDIIAWRIVLAYPDVGPGTAASCFIPASDLRGAFPHHLGEMSPGGIPSGLAVRVKRLFRVPKLYHLSRTHDIACKGHVFAIS